MKDFTNTHINANYRKGAQTYVGSLWFYEEGFEYKAKSVNSTIKFGKIAYSEIKEIKLINTLGIVPNGLLLRLKNGKEMNFVVSGRKAIEKFLLSKMN